MLSIPLPFIVGLVIALTLYRNLKGVETPGSKRYFVVFLMAYAMQGAIIGLRFGYGVEWLHVVQPVTAALMPPLAYLAFRSLAATPVARPALHLVAPLLVLLAVALLPLLVDLLLMLEFICYGVLLFSLTLKGSNALAETSLQRMVPAMRAARLSAILLLFFGIFDAALAVVSLFYGNALVPLAVTAMNFTALFIVTLYYFVPDFFGREQAAPSGAAVAGTNAEDEALLARIEAALDSNDLYRQEDLSLAKLARRTGATAREVSAAINRATGLNVSQFVNNRRIREACRLLEETNQPLTALMFECGFGTKSNFNREFRRVTGKSPSEWRAQARLKN
ncbi:helix-turn-helix domain-containing protein [Rhizobium helianthi]|uniref:Helix-turn-helix domain-containing protein n=1 Tax=Rhizobium helianthi TaxID=1132695 RepID=A0ABW4LZZ0_9HYPH